MPSVESEEKLREKVDEAMTVYDEYIKSSGGAEGKNEDGAKADGAKTEGASESTE